MSEAKYQQIFNEIQQQIYNGRLAPGDMLPSENELAARYDTSRITIRRSLNMLENQRIIRARHGKGYFVNAPEHQRYILIYENLINKLDSKLQYINLIHPDEEIQAALGLRSDQWVVSIQRTLRSTQQVLVCDQVYLPYQKGMPLVEAEIKYADFPDLVKNKTSEYSVYTRMEIGNKAVTGEVANWLSVPDGTWLLAIYRYLIEDSDRTVAFGRQYLHERCGKIVAWSGKRDL